MCREVGELLAGAPLLPPGERVVVAGCWLVCCFTYWRRARGVCEVFVSRVRFGLFSRAGVGVSAEEVEEVEEVGRSRGRGG